MHWKSFFRFFTQAWKKPIRKRPVEPRRARLLAEMLERRDLLTVPTATASIVSTGPLDGHPTITIQYSTPMDPLTAGDSTNYILLGSTGASPTIDSVTALNSTQFRLNYNGGVDLVVDNYTIFLKGDRLFDAPHVDAMAQPGQLIVANQGRNSVTIANMPGDGTVGAVSNYALPAIGPQVANPRLAAAQDLNGDQLADLVIVNTGTNQALIFLGQPAIDGGGYNASADLTLSLPVGAAPNLAKSLTIADLNNDNNPDLVFTNVLTLATPDNITVFLNQTVANGLITFDAGTVVDTDKTPVGVTAADFDNDGFVDLAVAIGSALTDVSVPADAINDYQVNIFPGDSNAPGTFTAASVRRVRIGDVSPTGVVAPTSIVSATLDNGNLPDLAIGATNGVFTLINTTAAPGVFTFTTLPALTGLSTLAVKTGSVNSDNRTDLYATTAVNTLMAFRNNGGGGPLTFSPVSFAIAAGVAGGLTVGDLDNNGRDDIVISNASAPNGSITVLRNDSDLASLTRDITSIQVPVATPGGPLEVTTASNHNLATGDLIYLSGAAGAFLDAASAPFVINAMTWTITKTSNSTFTLNGTDGVTGSSGASGKITQRGIIQVVVPGGASNVVLTTGTPHGLVSGDRVSISGLPSALNNGAFTIAVVDSTHFSLNGVTTGTAGTGLNGDWMAGISGTMTDATRTASVMTITTTAAHGLLLGDEVTIAGLTGLGGGGGGNGTFTIASVPTATTFTYANGGPDGTATITSATWNNRVSIVALPGINGAIPYNTGGTPLGVAIIAPGSNAPYKDANQDGRADVVVVNNIENTFTLFSGAGDGTLQTGLNVNLTPSPTSGLAIADLNNDSRPDIIAYNRVASSSSSKVSIMQGLSAGKYAAPIDFDTRFGGNSFNNFNSIAVGDIDNDGDRDIILVSITQAGGGGPGSTQHEVGFLENRYNNGAIPNITAGTSFIPRQEISTDENPLSVAVGYFNQDAFLDLAIAHNNGGGGGGNKRGLDVILGNNNFFSGQGPTHYNNNVPMSSIVVGDFNKDGNLDFIGGEDNAPGYIHVQYGDGKGVFSSGGSFATTIPNIGTLSAVDINADGYPDIVAGSKDNSIAPGAAGVAVLINQLGTGFGVALQSDAVPGSGVQQVLPNDVNQDGFVDLIITTSLPKFYARIESVSNQGGIFRIRSTAHGLQDGQQVTITGSNVAVLNGTWTIDVPGGGSGADNFDLTPGGPAFVAGYTNNIATWTLASTTYTARNNIFVMMGGGTGTFQSAVPYLAVPFLTGSPPAGANVPLLASGPSYVAATPTPLINVATFTSGGTIVNANLIANGDFESRDLNVEQGNLLGWQTFKLLDNPGSRGAWQAQTGGYSPLSYTSVPAPAGKYRAMLDQGIMDPNSNNSASTYEGSHALYQDVTIPAAANKVSLSLGIYIDNTDAGAYADGTSPTVPANLDYNSRGGNGNQQVRVDIVDPTAPILATSNVNTSGAIASINGDGLTDVIVLTTGSHFLSNNQVVAIYNVPGFTQAEGVYNVTVLSATSFRLNGNRSIGADFANGTWQTHVLRALFTTPVGTSNTINTTVQDLDLTAFKGRTIRLRIAAANNQGQLIVGIDNVRLNVQFTDTTAPAPVTVNLRNPAFVSAGVPHTNDPTFIGSIADNSGVASIAYVEFDTNNQGASGASYRKLTSSDWDANGYFALTLPNIEPGDNIVTINVVDKAQNKFTVVKPFFMQFNSVTEWESIGPVGIDVTGINGVDYLAISGRVTSVLSDLNDRTGNSYFIGSANGGIWRTTDGGRSWENATATVYDSVTGNPVVIPVAIGSIAQSVNKPNPAGSGTVPDTSVLYAGTGVGDQALDSRPGVGVLKSTDGGKTWKLLAGSTVLLKDARTSKVVVDLDNPDIAYVGVAVDGTGNGAIYKTSNGGLTWSNVLIPTNMRAGAVVLAPGTPIASVTDLIIDPAYPKRLFVGLGNIGLANGGVNVASAGVWFSPDDSGLSWVLQTGGAAAIPANTLPSGAAVGRVSIAMGTNGVRNEPFFYAMIATVPGSNVPPSVDWGQFSGLYKSKDNLANFTRVMLKEDVPNGLPTHNFRNINLLGRDGANAGALLVDPFNPNVVYVGGSDRWDPALAPNPNHWLIRVDTGNMQDTTYVDGLGVIPNDGEDIDKAKKATAQGNLYDPAPGPAIDVYNGEGVYWYDLATDASGQSGNLNSLPPAVTSLQFDSQGRLLIGTIGGIWRGIPYGFDYDDTSGGTGIRAGGGGGGGGGPPPSFSVPGMTLTSINGNLQISSMTSVAIDPLNRGVYYTTQVDTGVAKSTGSLTWVTQGLTGPTDSVTGINLGIPTAGRILTGFPPPTAAADTPVTLYRVWQYANAGALVPETSTDSGVTWTGIGLTTSAATTAGIFPAFAINPNPIQTGSPGVYQNELMFGANSVYFSPTSGNVWDSSFSPILSAGRNISALVFAPSATGSVIYAGTDDGQVFRRISAASWPAINGIGVNSLPFVAGRRNPINAITVDPNDARTVYAMLGGTGLASYVFKTNNADVATPTWTPVTPAMGVPAVPAYAMVIDRNVGLGAPNGRFYLANEVGVFTSVDNGATWTRLGLGLPNTPVVDLKLDTDRTLLDGTKQKGLNVLAAATLGRGIYTINTSAFSFIPDQAINEDPPAPISIPFTVNDPGLPAGSYTITATSNNQTLLPNGSITLGGSGQDRTLTFVPAVDQNSTSAAATSDGTLTGITVTLTSGTFVYSQKFLVDVAPVNDAPTLTIPTGTTYEMLKNPPLPGLQRALAIDFTVADVDNTVAAFVNDTDISATSRFVDQAIVPNGNIVISGTGANRTVTMTPAPNQSGSVQITLVVNDGGAGGIVTRTIDLLVSLPVDLSTGPFIDDFNRPASVTFLGAGWLPTVGDFDLVNTAPGDPSTGIARAMSPAINIVTLSALNTDDVALQADVQVAGAGIQYAGLVGRYAGPGTTNFYVGWLATFDGGNTFKAQIYKNVAGVWSQLASANVASGAGTLLFELAGSSLKLFYGAAPANLTLVTYVNDYALLTGSAGLLGAQGMTFDNFSATDISLTDASLPYGPNTFTLPNATQLTSEWLNQAGNFAINNNAQAGNGDHNLATLHGVSDRDVRVEANVNVAGAGLQYSGLIARYTGPGFANFYMGWIVTTNGGLSYQAEIYKSVAGTWTRLTSVNVGSGTGFLRFEVAGNLLKLFYGANAGSLVLISFTNDSSLAFGTVGMIAPRGQAIDNFAANLLPPTTANIPYPANAFSSPDGTQLTSEWVIQAGLFAARNQAQEGQTAFNLATLYNVAQSDVQVEANVSLVGAGLQYAGVLGRYSGPDASNFYLGWIVTSNGGASFQAEIYRNISGTWTRLVTAPVTSGTGLLRMELAGSSIKLFYGANAASLALVGFANDYVHTTGTLGMLTSQGCSFDNFAVNPLALTNAALVYGPNTFTGADGTQLGNEWLNQAGNFSVMTNRQQGQASGVNLATLNGVTQADVLLEANVNASGGSVPFTGLVGRYSGSGIGSFYVGWVLSTNGGATYQAEIYRAVNGGFTRLAGATVASGVGLLRLEIVGNSLRLYYGPNAGSMALVAFTNDDVLQTGTVGIFGSLGSTLDDFTATPGVTTNAVFAYGPNTFTGADGTQLPSEWTNRAGNFSVKSNTQEGVGSFNFAVLNGASAANVQAQANVTVVGAGVQYAGLLARNSSKAVSDFYLGWIITSNGGATFAAEIWKNVSGVWTRLSTATVATGTGLLRFRLLGSSLELYYGPNAGSLTLATFANDGPISAGNVGMLASKGSRLDDFTADAIVLGSPSLPYATETFTQADGTPLSANWAVQAGNYSVLGNAQAGQAAFNLASLNGIVQSDVRVEAAVSVTGAGLHYSGVLGRYSGPGAANFYMGWIITPDGGLSYRAEIYRNVNGTWTQLSSVPVGSGTGFLRLEIAGSSLKLFYGANAGSLLLITFAEDSALRTGSVGVLSSKNCTFDDFAASAVNLTNAVLPYPTNTFTAADGTQLTSEWLHQSGNFSVLGNSLFAQGSSINYATLNGLAQANMLVQANVNATGFTSFRYAGLVGRHGGPGLSNFYMGWIVSSNNGLSYRAEIFKNVNGTWTQLVSSNVSTGIGLLRFEIVGATLRLYFGPDAASLFLVAYVNDSSLTAGTAGILASQGSGIDDFTASSLAVSNAAFPYPANTFTLPDGTQLTSEWTTQSGNFSSANNTQQGQTAINLATLNGIAKANVQVDADVAVSGAGTQFAGVIGRYSGPGISNFIVGWIITTDGGATFRGEIWKNVNGTWTRLFTTAVSSGTGLLRLKMIGNILELHYGADIGNLTMIGVANDGVLVNGSVGMIASQGSTLDNLSVIAP